MPKFVKIVNVRPGSKCCRIVLPSDYVDHLNLTTGDYVALHKFEGNIVILDPAPTRPKCTVLRPASFRLTKS